MYAWTYKANRSAMVFKICKTCNKLGGSARRDAPSVLGETYRSHDNWQSRHALCLICAVRLLGGLLLPGILQSYVNELDIRRSEHTSPICLSTV